MSLEDDSIELPLEAMVDEDDGMLDESPVSLEILDVGSMGVAWSLGDEDGVFESEILGVELTCAAELTGATG
jgi:hypothetical protein